MTWISCRERLPPTGEVVSTKIANPDRNEQDLVRQGSLWFFPDRSGYVYYTPTHWKPKMLGYVGSISMISCVLLTIFHFMGGCHVYFIPFAQ